MTLTPQSVREKQFTPTRFKTGYDEDEVDKFLDEVEAELARLLDAQPPEQTAAGLATPLTNAPASAAPAGPPAGAPAPATVERPLLSTSAPGSPGQAELEEMLRRTLLLAQRTADEAVAEARAEAERTVFEAREQAAATLSAAREAAEAQARESAELLSRELAEHEHRRRSLATEVDQLRAFEQEYRTRLRAYLQMQLRELDGTALPAPSTGEPGRPDPPADPAVEETPIGPRVELAPQPDEQDAVVLAAMVDVPDGAPRRLPDPPLPS